jgi:hypothetical protein
LDVTFGLSTEAEIKAFQKAAGLLESGEVDNTTWRKLLGLLPPWPTPAASVSSAAWCGWRTCATTRRSWSVTVAAPAQGQRPGLEAGGQW